jgi:hypothetical protein
MKSKSREYLKDTLDDFLRNFQTSYEEQWDNYVESILIQYTKTNTFPEV